MLICGYVRGPVRYSFTSATVSLKLTIHRLQNRLINGFCFIIVDESFSYLIHPAIKQNLATNLHSAIKPKQVSRYLLEPICSTLCLSIRAVRDHDIQATFHGFVANGASVAGCCCVIQ